MNISSVLLSYLLQVNKDLSILSADEIIGNIDNRYLMDIENLFDLKFNPKYFDLEFNSQLTEESNRDYSTKRNVLIKNYAKYREIDLSGLELKDLQKQDVINKILFLCIELIHAIVRTNFFLRRDFVSIKISSKKLVNSGILSYKYEPIFETFVYSKDFEAIHIRGGKIARGGIRHSLRKDYRNEVLDLQQTQNLKNAIIIPSGAKGGFLIKSQELANKKDFVIACYQNLARALLDITDNLILADDNVNQQTSINKNVICYDERDYYLVFAADKGTGDFSDFANEISFEYDFWLQDAFASGGKNGYSHKGLGITAKGALECMEQHILDLDMISPKEGQVMEVFCLGNMSGDVAGNGMLYSKNFKLIVAVDSHYIFINPNPIDLDEDFAERKRLFKEEKKWNEYNLKLIGQGGGVFSRKGEKIVLSQEIREKFSIKDTEISPDNLVKKLMQYSYDIFWSGAIGTIVKSEREENSNITDKASENIRINAKDLKCKIFCEGANLSITEKGRVEFSLRNGMVNADFIDNSGGVNCSDYEVNIKIALNSSNISDEKKHELIKKMENEVCDLVLQNNKMQALVISKEFHNSNDKIVEHFELISFLRKNENFTLILKDFPSFIELEERAKKYNIGLTKPEIAILIVLSKIEMKRNLLNSDIDFKDPSLNVHLEKYFPSLLNEQEYKHLILNHPLRKEIIATQLCNDIVNVNGF